MRTLTYSLIVMAITATFGVGWLVDIVYEQYHTEQQTKDVDKLKLMEQLGNGLASSLEQIPNKSTFIEHWQQSDNEYQVDLIDIAEIPLPAGLLGQIQQGDPLLLESAEYLTFHYFLATTEQIFTLKTPIENIAPTENTTNYLFTLLFYAALTILMLLWVYPLIIRLIKLRKAAKSFGEGDLTQRIEMSATSYIHEIENEFNHMAQRIDDLVSDVKLLGSAVSHDLRTPLAKIQFGIDTLREEDNIQKRHIYEQKISEHVTEMTALVETLLRYARLDQNMLAMEKRDVDLDELVTNCIKHIHQEGVEIRYEKPTEKLFVLADASYMKMLVNNLLYNAVAYGNGVICIKLIQKNKMAIISVADNGQGIDESLHADLLKPFVRGQNNNNKGHGFGLAIVKRILDWHDGNIRIWKSSELSGAKFVVELPMR
jgi:two-component system OmpR family sensor kinase